MTKVKRVSVGNYVKADIDGKGNYVAGVVTDIDTKNGKVTFDAADGSGDVTVLRSELYKATKAEGEPAPQQTKTDPAPKAKPKKAVAKVVEQDDLEDDEDEDDEQLVGMAGHLKRARERYVKTKLPSGRTTMHNGDPVAVELHGMDLDAAKKHVAKKMGIQVDDLNGKYGHLNRGHQRMCIGLAYRKYLREEAGE